MWGRLIGTIIALIGVIMIYRARIITKKYINFGEENKVALTVKLIGFAVAIVGALVVVYIK